MEHAAETMAANADLGTMHDAYVIRHQLFTLERILSEQRIFVEDVKLAYLAKLKFKQSGSAEEEDASRSWMLSDDEMRDIRVKTARYHHMIRPALLALHRRMKEITRDDMMLSYQHAISLWGRGCVRAPCARLHKERQIFFETIALEREVRIGTATGKGDEPPGHRPECGGVE